MELMQLMTLSAKVKTEEASKVSEMTNYLTIGLNEYLVIGTNIYLVI